MDETSKQLVSEVNPPLPANPGQEDARIKLKHLYPSIVC